MFTSINLFFTTKLHLSNSVTRRPSNKLPGAQVSLNREWEGLAITFYAFSFQWYEGTAPLLSEGNELVWPLGAPGVAVSPGWLLLGTCLQLICCGMYKRAQLLLPPQWEVDTLCVSFHVLIRVRLCEVPRWGSSPVLWVFVSPVYEHILGLLSPCEFIIQRSGMMVIPVQWIQWVCLNA